MPADRTTTPVTGPPPGDGGRYDVVVVGGGTIGLAAAWRCAQRGLAVAVADPEPGRGASWVAAGMLAPVSEVHYGEEALLSLSLAAARQWPRFAAQLAEASGRPVGYHETGTLVVAADDGDRAWLEELHAFQRSLGLGVRWLSGREARRLEPALSPTVRGAIWAPDDHQVHNRMLLDALLEACRRRDVELWPRRVAALASAPGAVAGVSLEGGGTLAAPAVVLAAGCRSAELPGVPPGAVPPVRPVKGQILRLAPSPRVPPLTHIVRAVVAGSPVYLVPRGDGSVVVGATTEERGYDTAVTAGAVYQLLRDAHRVVPAVTEMTLAETGAGLRPGSPDNAPLVGRATAPGATGLVVATGHYRHGILLTPPTADAVAALVAGDDPPAAVAPFGPDRFAAAPPSAGGL